MKFAILVLSALWMPIAALANEEAPASIAPPVERQLIGITAHDATALIAKLEAAQNGLRFGEFQPFELMSGSIASYDKTKTPPREAFLAVPFDKVWQIRRIETKDTPWQSFRLAYAPNGLGQLYWDIEVVLGSTGNLERVSMMYRPPAPF